MTPFEQQQAAKILLTYGDSNEFFNKSREILLKKAEELSETLKFKEVMSEWKEGTLTTSEGEIVEDQNQALAIAFSEARSEIEKDMDLGGELIKARPAAPGGIASKDGKFVKQGGSGLVKRKTKQIEE